MSLGGTGVAVACPPEPLYLTRIGSPPTSRSLADRSSRLRLQADAVVRAVCIRGLPDLVAVEAPLMGMRSTGSSHDRSGLWWLVLARLTGNGVPCVEVINSQLKQHALGKGSGKGTDKDYVLSSVIRRWGHLIDQPAISNDEADALVLADMVARHLGHALVELPQTHLRAMGTVPWPQRQEQHG